MAISNIPLPSFTLVLTSGNHSHRRHPAACILLPSAPDHHLMKTIDLHNETEGDGHDRVFVSSTSNNNQGSSASQENEVLPAIFEEATPSSESVAKEAGQTGHSIKALLPFLHKFVFKRKLALVKKMSSST